MVVASASKARRLGTKHRCPGCGTRFYDFGRSNPTCPKCGEASPDEATTRVDVLALAKAANDDDDSKSKLLSGLSDEEVALAKRDDVDSIAELLVSYDW